MAHALRISDWSKETEMEKAKEKVIKSDELLDEVNQRLGLNISRDDDLPDTQFFSYYIDGKVINVRSTAFDMMEGVTRHSTDVQAAVFDVIANRLKEPGDSAPVQVIDDGKVKNTAFIVRVKSCSPTVIELLLTR